MSLVNPTRRGSGKGLWWYPCDHNCWIHGLWMVYRQIWKTNLQSSRFIQSLVFLGIVKRFLRACTWNGVRKKPFVERLHLSQIGTGWTSEDWTVLDKHGATLVQTMRLLWPTRVRSMWKLSEITSSCRMEKTRSLNFQSQSNMFSSAHSAGWPSSNGCMSSRKKSKRPLRQALHRTTRDYISQGRLNFPFRTRAASEPDTFFEEYHGAVLGRCLQERYMTNIGLTLHGLLDEGNQFRFIEPFLHCVPFFGLLWNEGVFRNFCFVIFLVNLAIWANWEHGVIPCVQKWKHLSNNLSPLFFCF